MNLKSLIAVAAISAATLISGAAAANAGGRHHSHFGFGHHHGHGLRIVVGEPRDCGYYWFKYQETGRFFWKKRFYQCRNYW